MILEKYDLPSLSTLLTTRPAHSAWKNYVHERISSYCWSELQESARQKSSLTAIDWTSCSVGAVHHVWKDLKTPMDIKRASTKAKLMCDVYLLSLIVIDLTNTRWMPHVPYATLVSKPVNTSFLDVVPCMLPDQSSCLCYITFTLI